MKSDSYPRIGYLRVLVMLKREGWAVGKKRVYRLYRLEGLQLDLGPRPVGAHN
jgi:putative transposase